MSYRLVFTKQARRDAKKILGAGLKNNVVRLLAILEDNPVQSPPGHEKLLDSHVDTLRVSHGDESHAGPPAAQAGVGGRR